MQAQGRELEIFKAVDLTAPELVHHPRSLQDLHERTKDVLMIRNMFSQIEAETVVQRLENGEIQFTRFEYPWGHVFGRVLFGSKPDLPAYFADAEKFRRDCRTLFSGVTDFETRVEEILRTVSGGLPIEVPQGPDGQSYSPATIRFMKNGHELPIHCGKQFLNVLPSINHHAMIVDYADQLSYFVMLDPPVSGGELVLYDVPWPENYQGVLNGNKADHEVIARSIKIPLALRAGDMIIFNGGRIWHSVARVHGLRPRKTIGGFIAYAVDHRRFYYWS